MNSNSTEQEHVVHTLWTSWAIPHLFERLFLISWENNRDCHITMPLSLKTMEVQIKGDQWNKRFKTVQVYWTSCRSCWPRGFGALNSSPQSEYFLPSQWVPVLSPTLTIQTADNTVTKSGRNLSDMLKSTFKIVAMQLPSVKIAPKSPFLRVKRIPIRYSVRVCARSVR